MTPPAIVLLTAAIVCSISVTGFERAADHDKKRDLTSPVTKNVFNIYEHDMKMNISRTNAHKNSLVGKHISIRNNELNLSENETIYKANHPIIANLRIHRDNVERLFKNKKVRQYNVKNNNISKKRRIKREDTYDPRCDDFRYRGRGLGQTQISHPKEKNSKNNLYSNNTRCNTTIYGTEGEVVQLTFVDVFHIEHHPECAYDYLEIRDGVHGYARLLNKVCGDTFPNQIISSGPNVWLKFRSDETIEYEGFHINVGFIQSTSSHSIPDTCYKNIIGNAYGVIDSKDIDKDCISRSANQALDVLWYIESPPNTKIYLNFTTYEPAVPNDCENNLVQVFGSVLEYEAKLAHYCGSVANSVTTKDGDGKNGGKEEGNKMYVRLFASKAAKTMAFNATFTAYRSLDPTKNEICTAKEFDCEDNTCIAIDLKCDKYAHCRLKADEDYELCKGETESVLSDPHIMVILVIFSLILSGMSFVFVFKCIRKLYQDHKIIKEHIRQSCEDRLDSLVGSRLTLDPKRLQMDSEPRASLERENHANEMFKQQRNFSQHKPSSIDSDFIQETHLDLDDESWRRDVDSVPIETEDVRIEKNHRSRRSDSSKKEESIRKRSTKESDRRKEEKKQIRDVSVGAPDTKEEGCQTRESLFQAGTAIPSSEGTESGTNSRGFSTFGHSGATLTRSSPPVHTNTAEITIELMKQDSKEKPQKKMLDRRPMSTETTRSAPDVIIVSKPIR